MTTGAIIITVVFTIAMLVFLERTVNYIVNGKTTRIQNVHLSIDDVTQLFGTVDELC